MKLTELVMLARVMSQKYGVDVKISPYGNLASCSASRVKGLDGQWKFTISLPWLKDKGKFDRMVHGYLDHEIGHVLYTDFNYEDSLRKSSALPGAIHFKDLWNIFEDVYVESKMCETFPGSGINLKSLARGVFTDKMALDSMRDIRDSIKKRAYIYSIVCSFTSSYCLFKRRSMADRALAHSDKLLASVRNSLADMDSNIASVLDTVDRVLALPANSSRETYALALQIWEALNSLRNISWKPQQTSGDDSSQDDTDVSDGAEESNAVSSKISSAINHAAKEMSASGKDVPLDKAPVPFYSDISSALSMMIRYGIDGAERDCSENLGFNALMSEFDRVGRMSVVSDRYSQLDTDTVNRISALQSCFMRTIPGLLQSVQFTSRRVGYMGRMSGHDLHKAGVGDGRIFQRKAERKEQRVDVAILLDVSGSMFNDIDNALVTMYAMLGMLKTLPKVHSYAAAFSGSLYCVVSRFSDQRIESFYRISTIGSTPTAGAVLKTTMEFSSVSGVRRIMFVITDGDPDDVNAFMQAMDVAHAQGIETYGIGLRNALADLEDQFGKDNVVQADDIKALPMKMADMMKAALVRAVA